MNFSNRHDVIYWLDGAAKFFWSALFVRQSTNLWGIPAWNSAGPIYKVDLF